MPNKKIFVLVLTILFLGTTPALLQAQCIGPATYTVSTSVSGVNINLNSGQLLIITSTGVINSGNINMNGGTICNQGTIQSAVALNMNSGTFNNYGTLNRVNFSPPSGLNFNNYNIVNVSGNLVINSGVNWFEDGRTTVGGSMQVNAFVNGSPNVCGGFIVAGFTTINSNGSLSQIDFCDLGNPPQHADVLNGTFQSSVTFCVCNFSPLPVELASYTVQKKQDEYGVDINWSTSSEKNNEGFYIEHSTDMIHFKQIARLDGCGNCNTMNTYSFTDNNPANGINYYRLVQKDYDGKEEILGLKSVDVKNTTTARLLNMGNGAYQLAFESVTGDCLLQVISIDGKTILEQRYQAMEGNNLLSFSLSYPQLVSIMLTKPDGSIYTTKCAGF